MPFFAPTGRRNVATGGAPAATWRAVRNPWKRSCFKTSAPLGAVEALGRAADQCAFAGAVNSFAPPGREEDERTRFPRLDFALGRCKNSRKGAYYPLEGAIVIQPVPVPQEPKLPSSKGEKRGSDGRYLPGNPGRRGNPHAAAVAAWRKVSPADLAAVVRVLVERAKAGEPWAVKQLLDRCLGRAPAKAEDPAPIQPRVVVNTDLGRIWADRMAAAALEPSAPGLAPPRFRNEGPGTTAPPPSAAEA